MPNAIKVCSFPECGLVHKAKGLCTGHYRQRLRGVGLTPLSGHSKTSSMSVRDRFEHYVDRTGECHVWTGRIGESGYGNFKLDGRTRRAHRVSVEIEAGPMPAGSQVDHTCYNRACVNPGHLRVVTHKQNQENRSGLDSDNKSGYRGVRWVAGVGKWRAAVVHNRTRHDLGYFDDVHEAGEAALAKRLELHTHSDGR